MVVALGAMAQQDPQYSQYQFNQMVINPAYAGSRDAISAVIDVRQQWTGIDGAPRTQSFSLHGPLRRKRIGLGLSGYADQIGPKKIVAAYGNFAYILPLNTRLKLSFGLRAGIINYNFDWSKVTYRDQTETMISNPVGPQTKLDADFGLYLKSQTFFMGLSATHITQPYIYQQSSESVVTPGVFYTADYRLQPHLFFVLGKAWAFGDNVVFNPTLMLRHTATVNGGDLNFNFLLKQKVWLGVFTRSDKTVGALVQVYATEKLRIGYAFDRGLGKVQRQLGNSHEIMIGFDFNTVKSKMLSPRLL